MFRVLTVAREFGSGGGSIARLVAERLNWKLLDHALVTEIARAANVDPALVRRFDERLDSWVHRVARRALFHGAPEGVAAVTGEEFFDAETMAALAASLIKEAERQGNCVIVGRGGQCVLQECADAFHVFVYAPWKNKVDRVKARVAAGVNVEKLIVETDRARREYTKAYFEAERMNPHLYDLMLCSSRGEEYAASVILAAMEAGTKHE